MKINNKLIGIVAGVVILLAIGFLIGMLIYKSDVDVDSFKRAHDTDTATIASLRADKERLVADYKKEIDGLNKRNDEEKNRLASEKEALRKNYDDRLKKLNEQIDRLEKEIGNRDGLIRKRDAILLCGGFALLVLFVAGTLIGASYRNAARKVQATVDGSKNGDVV